MRRPPLRLPRTVSRFATVGIVNTTIDVVLFGLLHAAVGIVVANFVSTSVGMAFSFLANGRHTFGAGRLTVRQALLFVATNGFTMWLLQPLLIHAAYDAAGVPLMPAKVLSLGSSVVANFLLYRYVVWRPSATVVSSGSTDGITPSTLPAGLAAAPEAARR